MGSQTSKATKRPANQRMDDLNDIRGPKSNTDSTRIPSQQGRRTDQFDDHHQSRSDEFSSSTPSRPHHHHHHSHDHDSHSHHHPHHHHQHHHHHHEHYPTLSHHDHLHERKIVINRWPTMDPEAMQNNKPKSFYDEYIKP